MRLPALRRYVVIMVVGDIIISVGEDRKWVWEAIGLVRYFFIGIKVSLIQI